MPQAISFVNPLTETNTKSVIDIPVETPATENESQRGMLKSAPSNPYEFIATRPRSKVSIIDGIYVSTSLRQSVKQEQEAMSAQSTVKLTADAITPYLQSILDEIGGPDQFTKEDLVALAKFTSAPKSDFTFDIQDLYRHDEY